jgi:hypothetical protein
MRRYGLVTRAAMFVVGTAWSAVGAAWLYHLGPSSGLVDLCGTAALVMPIALLVGGLILLKNAVVPDRPKSFEEEVPDANPNLDDGRWQV